MSPWVYSHVLFIDKLIKILYFFIYHSLCVKVYFPHDNLREWRRTCPESPHPDPSSSNLNHVTDFYKTVLSKLVIIYEEERLLFKTVRMWQNFFEAIVTKSPKVGPLLRFSISLSPPERQSPPISLFSYPSPCSHPSPLNNHSSPSKPPISSLNHPYPSKPPISLLSNPSPYYPPISLLSHHLPGT